MNILIVYNPNLLLLVLAPLLFCVVGAITFAQPNMLPHRSWLLGRIIFAATMVVCTHNLESKLLLLFVVSPTTSSELNMLPQRSSLLGTNILIATQACTYTSIINY